MKREDYLFPALMVLIALALAAIILSLAHKVRPSHRWTPPPIDPPFVGMLPNG